MSTQISLNPVALVAAPAAVTPVVSTAMVAAGTPNTLIDCTATYSEAIVESNFRKLADVQAAIITAQNAVVARLQALGIFS